MQETDQLSQAIKALEAQRDVLGDGIVDAALAPLQEKLAGLEARQPAAQQRRLVTVLFLDMANSTHMTQGLEPEEVREVVGGALKRLAAPVEACGGQVTQFMGDGFVAVFGLARVQENDARQAVRAALAVQEEARACAAELGHRSPIKGFEIRIGINTGRVVAGRFSEAESTLMGLAVSLAARIEQAALPGTVYISQFTYQHVRGAFEVEPLPPIKAKGFAEPVAVYRVQAARPRTFRTFTRGVEGIRTKLVGRDAELRQLLSTLERAIQHRETQLVTVTGDPGVGKSRLLYEFDSRIALSRAPVIAFKGRASPQTMAVPFGLLREMICYHLGVLASDPVDLSRRRLVETFSEALPEEPEMKAHFVGALLGFAFPGSPYLQAVEHDPRQLLERAQLYLTQYFAAVAGKTTTIIMLDDLHWADTPSLNFVDQLVHACPRLPLLVVCLARPALAERFPDWGQEEAGEEGSLPGPVHHPRTTYLTLGPLSRQASLELLGEILRNVETLPVELCERILDSAEGNPFYLEEFIQALVDARAIRKSRRGGTWKLDRERLGRLELPATLLALLEARLDSLDPAQRNLVQQAAVIGRVFWRSALQAVRGGKAVTDSDLKSLSRRGFFYLQERSIFARTEEYRFHHGLLRDAAYQALLKPDRLAYHAQAAAWLIGETQACGRAAEFAPVIAEHYASAGESALAADWFTYSGMLARNQCAPAQAFSFFGRALALLPDSLAPGLDPADLARYWQALAGRDEVLGILGDTAARMADDVALVALAKRIGDDHLVAEAYYRQGYYLGMSGQFLKELEAYNHGLAAALRANDRRRQTLILGLKVMCEIHLGDLQAAARTAAAALLSVEDLTDDQVLARNLNNVSIFYTETGDLARAAQLLDRQLTINRRTGNLEGEVVGLSNLGYIYIQLGMPEPGIATLQQCKQMAALQQCKQMARDIGHRSFYAYGSLNLALAFLRSVDLPSALAEVDQILPELQAMNDVFGHAVGQSYAALAREQDGQVEEALAGFEQAADALGKIGAPGNEHDAKAGVARCLLAMNDVEAARRHAAALWDYLQSQSGGGMEFPLLGYETCADVFTATGEELLAQQVLEAAYGELMARAGRISLPEWRRSYLENVPEHHRIRDRWQINLEKSDDQTGV
jgi:class 3 adenylate cyclase/tetratricopeptide (TPR) repeat protein